MNTTLTEPQRRNLRLLRCDKKVGHRLLTFHEIGWDRRFSGLKVKCSFSWIAKAPEGGYGIVGGGMKNLECFIEYIFNIGSWCFNSWPIEDYVWSRVNQAYIKKDSPFVNIPAEIGAHYVFCSTDVRSGQLTKIYRIYPLNDTLIWERGMAQLVLSVPDGNYCWDPTAVYGNICSYFNNEGGSPRCEIFTGATITRDGKGRCVRPKCCAEKLKPR